MPLFIFIAGVFHKDKNIKQKVLAFITLGLMLKILLCLVKIVFKEPPTFSLLSDAEVPWYMFGLSAFIVMTYLLKDYNKLYIIIFFFILGCFIGYDRGTGDYLYLSRIIIFYPFYLLGNYINKKNIKKLTEIKWLKVLSILCLLIWGFMCFEKREISYNLRGLFTARNSFMAINFQHYKYMIIHRITCYLITIATSISIISITPKKKLKYITTLGSRTLQVYFWHIPIMIILTKTPIYDYLMMTSLGKIVWLLIGIILVLVLSIKVFSIPTNKVIDFFKVSKRKYNN